MKQLIRDTLRRFGYDVVRYPPKACSELDSLSDLSEEEKRIILAARPFTMTSVERMAALVNAVTYITKNQIPGDIVECGVWRWRGQHDDNCPDFACAWRNDSFALPL